MRWVSRNVMQLVMPNPYNHMEKIKPTKANEIFSSIQKVYIEQFSKTWARTLIPLEFFANEYSKRIGQPIQEILIMFNLYFDKKESELYDKQA